MSASIVAINLKRFYLPQLVIGRFVAVRTMRSAAIWGLVFGLSVASSAVGFISAYTTEASRRQLAASLGNNVGLQVMLGKAHNIDTVAGFTQWRALGLVSIIGAIWALLISTKTFRGEEAAGRWELFLSGQTTARRAAANALMGLSAGLVAMYLLVVIAIIAVGHVHNVDFTVSQSLVFALALVANAAQFLAIGALASQIMPIRSRAATLAASIFGVFFVMRALANASASWHWLIYITPMGWTENLQPLTSSQPLWLLPICSFIIVLSVLTVFMAGKRDLGDSLLADKDTAKPHTRLLNGPLAIAIRLTRASIIGWLLAIAVISLAFGSIARTAGDAFSASQGARQAIGRIAHQAQVTGSTAFLGIMFFMIIIIMMAYAASAIGSLREDEAEGYLDNLLTRSVGRLQWLWGRVFIIFATVVAAGITASVFVWFGAVSQHTSGVTFHDLLLAGVNAMAPAIFTLGIGVLAFGFSPRLTTIAAYGIIAGSFLMELIGSGVNLNHWILDISVLHHIALAPATSPNWTAAAILSGMGIIACFLGALRFGRRDLANE